MTTTHYDVMIAGAGPVGLFLACELALGKCSVLIVEKADTPDSPLKQLPFGVRGLSSQSVQALDRRNLLTELELHKHFKNPHMIAKQDPLPRRQAGHFAGLPFYFSEIDETQWPYQLPGSTPKQILSEMQELETVLTRRAEALGVSIKRGLTVTGLSQTETDVTLKAGQQCFTGQWLVGCDGGRSAVRKLAGFEFVGTEPEFTGYSAQVELAEADLLQPGRNVTERGMYLQSQPGFIILQDFDGGAFHQAKQPVSLEHLQAVLRRISNTDVSINALQTVTTWSDRSMQVTQYRKGRIFLAGDAAHIHSPLGGQGLNLGLGDAFNLGWKLAACLKYQAPDSLLDTYQAERHPIGAQILDWSRAQVALMRPDRSARALQNVMRDLLNTRDGATYMAAKIWGMFTHYDFGDRHPLLGYCAPDFEFEDGTRLSKWMHNGQGILLDLEVSQELQTLASEFSDRIKYLPGPVKVSFGLKAILIRPDGIVAWASDKDRELDQIKRLLTQHLV